MREAKVLSDLIVMVLAGGQGERLYPLTKERAKPAVPFGGTYRMIDFPLSNCLNSGLRRIYVLTQYKSDSLNKHIRLAWNIFNPELNEYIEIRPPQQRMSADWYLGTAHAIYQNIYTLEHERPRWVLILSADHVYRMDYSQMLAEHLDSGAQLTVACIHRPMAEAGRLGVVEVDSVMRAVRFAEKPKHPRPAPDAEDCCLCSMGIYIFDTEALVRRVIEDAKAQSTHDFARDVLPAMIRAGDHVHVYHYKGSYWRDIGTLDAYWDAHMDLVSVQPAFNLYDTGWPVRGAARSDPPAKFVFGEGTAPRAKVHDSLVGGGSIISGAYVSRSVIGNNVRIEVGSHVEEAVILDGTSLGRDVRIKRAVIDKANRIPDGAAIGVDEAFDRCHFCISEGGIVAIAKGVPFPSQSEAEQA